MVARGALVSKSASVDDRCRRLISSRARATGMHNRHANARVDDQILRRPARRFRRGKCGEDGTTRDVSAERRSDYPFAPSAHAELCVGAEKHETLSRAANYH